MPSILIIFLAPKIAAAELNRVPEKGLFKLLKKESNTITTNPPTEDRQTFRELIKHR